MDTDAVTAGRGQGGFALIELAIVLIIIGLIIGAVLKGQDLITNARAKRVANFMRQAEVAAWTHYDRMGYFPGDSQNRDGNLAQDTSNFYGDLTGAPPDNAISAGIQNFQRTLALGSSTLHIGMGMFADLAPNPPMLCIVTTGDVFSDQERIYGRMLDTAIDGVADGDSGKVLAMTQCGAVNAKGIVTCASPVEDWNAAGIEGVCYLFDTGSLP